MNEHNRRADEDGWKRIGGIAALISAVVLLAGLLVTAGAVLRQVKITETHETRIAKLEQAVVEFAEVRDDIRDIRNFLIKNK